jgi:hypothetical protein
MSYLTGLDIKRMELKRHFARLGRIAKYMATQMLLFIGGVVVVVGIASWIASFFH